MNKQSYFLLKVQQEKVYYQTDNKILQYIFIESKRGGGIGYKRAVLIFLYRYFHGSGQYKTF